jgi:hypothetical protein
MIRRLRHSTHRTESAHTGVAKTAGDTGHPFIVFVKIGYRHVCVGESMAIATLYLGIATPHPITSEGAFCIAARLTFIPDPRPRTTS